jgi:hypothetical protein
MFSYVLLSYWERYKHTDIVDWGKKKEDWGKEDYLMLNYVKCESEVNRKLNSEQH